MQYPCGLRHSGVWWIAVRTLSQTLLLSVSVSKNGKTRRECHYVPLGSVSISTLACTVHCCVICCAASRASFSPRWQSREVSAARTRPLAFVKQGPQRCSGTCPKTLRVHNHTRVAPVAPGLSAQVTIQATHHSAKSSPREIQMSACYHHSTWQTCCARAHHLRRASA